MQDPYSFIDQSQYGLSDQQYAMMNQQAYHQRISTNSLTSFNSVQGPIYPVGYTSSNIGFGSQHAQVSVCKIWPFEV